MEGCGFRVEGGKGSCKVRWPPTWPPAHPSPMPNRHPPSHTPTQAKGFDPATPDPSGPLQFIDYEYGCYTPRGFDIGNHFNEYAGFECDYTR